MVGLADINGCVPAVFHLSANDNAHPTTPIPVQLLLPRTSLLVATRSTVLAAFRDYVMGGNERDGLFDVWLSFGGCGGQYGFVGGRPIQDSLEEIPLLWQYPVGTIADSIALGASHLVTSPPTSSQNQQSAIKDALLKIMENKKDTKTTHDELVNELKVVGGNAALETCLANDAAQEALPIHFTVHIRSKSADDPPTFPGQLVSISSVKDEQMLVSQLMKQANFVLFGKIGPFLQIPPVQTTTLRCAPLLALTSTYEHPVHLATASTRNPGRVGAGDTAVVINDHPLSKEAADIASAVKSSVFYNHSKGLDEAHAITQSLFNGAGGKDAVQAYPVVVHIINEGTTPLGQSTALASRVTRPMNYAEAKRSPSLMEGLHQVLAFPFLHEGAASGRYHNLTNNRHRKDNEMCNAFSFQSDSATSWVEQLASVAIPPLNTPDATQRLRTQFVELVVEVVRVGLATEEGPSGSVTAALLATGSKIFEEARSIGVAPPVVTGDPSPPKLKKKKVQEEVAGGSEGEVATTATPEAPAEEETAPVTTPVEEVEEEEEEEEEEEDTSAPMNTQEGLPLPTSSLFKVESGAGLKSLARAAVLAESLRIVHFLHSGGNVPVVTATITKHHMERAGGGRSGLPRVLVGGYEAHLNTPMEWLLDKHSCSDMRVHISIRMDFH